MSRHAQATQVYVNLVFGKEEIRLQIKDNGIGIDPETLKDKKSLGLIGMRERLGYLNGELKITGAKGQGTVVQINIPLKQAKTIS